ncbi:MAG: hypothetical protein AB1449_04975 [Chloroflexota bacterium]
MDVGMLWFDPDVKADLGIRVERAAAYYHRKYGRRPSLCFLHPATGGSACPRRVAGVEVRLSRSVLPNHFWLGMMRREQEGEPKLPAAA